MVKKFIKFLFLISGSLLTAALWILQEIKDKPYTPSYIKEHEVGLGCCIFALVVVVNIAYFILVNNSKSRIVNSWTHMLIKHMRDQYLAKDCYKTRITIFRPRTGWKTWWWYLTKAGLCNIANNWRRKRTLLYWKKFPSPFSVYLQRTDRISNSKEPASITIFKTTTRGQDYNGVADKCYREDIDSVFVEADLLNIDELPKECPTDQSDKSKTILEFMEKTHIGKDFYDTLQTMNYPAHQILAFPLRSSDEKIWGIVVIDSEDQLEHKLDKLLMNHIGDYQIMFRSMISSIQER